MIEINGKYFDKIRYAKVIHVENIEWEHTIMGEFPSSIHCYWDIEVNGIELGYQLDKDDAEKLLKKHMRKRHEQTNC